MDAQYRLRSLAMLIVHSCLPFQKGDGLRLAWRKREIKAKKIRVGGMVKENSVETFDNEIKFIITDFKNELFVSFVGSVPNLFEEGKGVVAEGFLEDRNYLKADKILAKHDENYMPPEVSEALKDKN